MRLDPRFRNIESMVSVVGWSKTGPTSKATMVGVLFAHLRQEICTPSPSPRSRHGRSPSPPHLSQPLQAEKETSFSRRDVASENCPDSARVSIARRGLYPSASSLKPRETNSASLGAHQNGRCRNSGFICVRPRSVSGTRGRVKANWHSRRRAKSTGLPLWANNLSSNRFAQRRSKTDSKAS